MIEKIKKITAYLDVWKKLLQTVLIIGPSLTVIFGAGVWAIEKVYHKEIEEYRKLGEFMQLAKDSILPHSSRVHSYQNNAIEKLQSKHNGSFAIGLRWDEEQGKIMYRGIDKVLREAHKNPVDGSWYYIKDGQPAYVYE